MPMREIYCPFCKNNGESELYYKGHKLRDENNVVTCPVLAVYTCPGCGVTGDHTSSYCPKSPKTPYVKKSSTPPAKKLQFSREPNQSNNINNICINNTLNNKKSGNNKAAPSAKRRTSSYMPPSLRQSGQVSLANLPPLSRPGGTLTSDRFRLACSQALKLEPNSRMLFFELLDYNPARLEFIKQAACLAEFYTLLYNEGMK